MEQRPLRLGDIVDDYCPRERRVTNHAIVAIIEDAIRQTRCTTCDAEHVYKHAKEPRRRKKDDGAGDESIELTPGQLVAPRAAAPASPSAAATPPLAATPARVEPPPAEVAIESDEAPAARDEVWPLHRQLIRATLPRVDGEPPPPRPIPEFTMHQRQRPRGGFGARGYGYGGGWGGNGNGNGNANGNGNVNGNANGNGNGPGHERGRHGRHRSRHKRPR
ncbi:MAG TPA: hypothetical protein VHD57_06960 [Vicinamibacterales bacterium]|jgi:hypothetical protein|nr:hypothetical protein [Vicinamibacterales bacterium]